MLIGRMSSTVRPYERRRGTSIVMGVLIVRRGSGVVVYRSYSREALGQLALEPAVGGLVVRLALEIVGKVLLTHDAAFEVVGVPVALAVAELLHQLRRRV